MIIGHSEDTLLHESQNAVQGAANERIFEALGIAAKIEQIVSERAEQVLPYTGDMESAKVQARKWVCEALCDYIAALADYEVMLIK